MSVAVVVSQMTLREMAQCIEWFSLLRQDIQTTNPEDMFIPEQFQYIIHPCQLVTE